MTDLHLKEFRDLLEMADDYKPGRGIPEPPDEEGIRRAIQVLLARQCIYPNQHSIAPTYRVLATPRYQDFFRRYFSAMGLELEHDTRSGMIALKVPEGQTRYDHQAGRLRKDETAVLLTLRQIYEEAYNAKQFDELGQAESSTDELYERLAVVGEVEIEYTRLMDILKYLRRKGIVELGERDREERLTPITILPGIAVVVPRTYVEIVRNVSEEATAAAAAMPRIAEQADEDGSAASADGETDEPSQLPAHEDIDPAPEGERADKAPADHAEKTSSESGKGQAKSAEQAPQTLFDVAAESEAEARRREAEQDEMMWRQAESLRMSNEF